MITKNEARKIAGEKISEMTAYERSNAGRAIVDAIISFDEFRTAGSIFIFKNVRTEPETTGLIETALAADKTVSTPQTNVTCGDEDMSAIKITENTVFIANKWGISEPINGVAVEKIDLAVIPVVAFDGLKRTGHGKGYYDKFLSRNECYKIGAAFDCQSVNGLETEPHDVELDVLVTEKRIVYKGGTTVANPFAD